MSSCFESEGSYINMEGRLQISAQVVEPPGNSKELWRVLRVLSSVFGVKNSDFDSLEELRQKFLPDINTGEVVNLDSVKINDDIIDGKSAVSGHNGGMQLFHFFPIYSTDAIVRRASSLQKTNQAKKPVAIFIFSKEHKQNELVLESTSDEKVSKGVIAVAVGSLKAANVDNEITSFQKLQD